MHEARPGAVAGEGDEALPVVAVRVLLLHSGGSLWVDAVGMQGARVAPMVRWLGASGQADLGAVPEALGAMPCLQDGAAARLSHFVVALSAGEVPAGESAQVAVALSALWFWTASRQGMPCARPLGPPVTAARILAGTGRIVQRPGVDGLYRYAVGEVGDLDAKVAALATRRGEAEAIDLVVPASQATEAAAAIASHFPDARAGATPLAWRWPAGAIRVFPVAGIEDLQDVVEVVCADARRSSRVPADLEPGVTLEGRFVLAELLGEGGAGSVWRAHDRQEGVEVALKVLHPHLARDPARLGAFYRGARHMVRLAGPGVARIVHSPGSDGPHRYFALALLPGGTLHQAVQSGRAARGVAPILELAAILGRAHDAGIVHGDVKPSNVLYDANGALVLVDFDLGRERDARGATTRTLGSLAYCAPELLDAAPATAASDVYGLAMTALFLLHGAELPAAALREPRDFLDGVVAPAAIKWALAEALSPDPSRRPADGHALARALHAAVARGDLGPPYRGPSARVVADGRRASRRLGVAAAILAVVAVAGLFASRTAAESARTARAEVAAERRIERALRVADGRPGEALAVLRAAGRLDDASAASLLAAGGSVRVLTAPSKVLAVAVSADGARVAAGTLGGVVVAWDVATGAEAYRVETGLERVTVLRFTPDGRALAAWAGDAELRGEHDAPLVFLNATSGARVDVFAAAASPIDVRFGDDHALTLHTDRVVFWDLATGAPLREVAHPTNRGFIAPHAREALILEQGRASRHDGAGEVAALAPIVLDGRHAWSGDGARFALGSPTTLRVYDTDSLSLLAAIPVACHRRIVLDATGTRAICGGEGTDAAWVSIESGEVVPLEHGARLSTAAFLEGVVATTTFDGGVFVWDVARGALVAFLAGHDGLVTDVAALGREHLVTGGLDGTVRLWSLTDVAPPHDLIAHDVVGDPAIHDAAVAWRGVDGALRIDGRAVGAADDVRALDFSTDGRWLLASGGREAEIWGADGASTSLGRYARTGALSGGATPRVGLIDASNVLWVGAPGEDYQRVSDPSRTLLQGVAWTPDGAHLVVFPYKGHARVHDRAGHPVARLAGLIEGVTDHRFLDDGGLAVGTWSTHAGIWDVRSGARRIALDGHTEEVVALDVSADESLVATGSWDDTARVWRRADGALRAVLSPHGGDVVDVAFSPDGARIATLTNDRRIRFFDAEDGSIRAIQPGSRARRMAWRSDGLLTVEIDGSLRRWEAADRPQEGWLERVGARTNLRLCADTSAVVAVVPWPDPSSLWAPASACSADRADESKGRG